MLETKIYIENEKTTKEVSDLYLSAFPEEERPPLEIFLNSLKKKEITLLTFYYE